MQIWYTVYLLQAFCTYMIILMEDVHSLKSVEYKVKEIIRYNFECREIGNRLNLNVQISITKEIYVYLNRFRNWMKNRLLSILISSSLFLTKQYRKGGGCIFYYVGLQPCGALSLWVLILYFHQKFACGPLPILGIPL